MLYLSSNLSRPQLKDNNLLICPELTGFFHLSILLTQQGQDVSRIENCIQNEACVISIEIILRRMGNLNSRLNECIHRMSPSSNKELLITVLRTVVRFVLL